LFVFNEKGIGVECRHVYSFSLQKSKSEFGEEEINMFEIILSSIFGDNLFGNVFFKEVRSDLLFSKLRSYFNSKLSLTIIFFKWSFKDRF
jgi:hypothetical protein